MPETEPERVALLVVNEEAEPVVTVAVPPGPELHSVYLYNVGRTRLPTEVYAR